MWLTFHVQTCFTSVEIETMQFHHLLIGFNIQALHIIAELSFKGIVLKTMMFLLQYLTKEARLEILQKSCLYHQTVQHKLCLIYKLYYSEIPE